VLKAAKDFGTELSWTTNELRQLISRRNALRTDRKEEEKACIAAREEEEKACIAAQAMKTNAQAIYRTDFVGLFVSCSSAVFSYRPLASYLFRSLRIFLVSYWFNHLDFVLVCSHAASAI
jgi:hypothetical protein